MPDPKDIIHLPSAGSIPGIPGSHGPGAYVINWAERTLKRLEDVLDEEFNQLKEAPATGVSLEGISLPADGVEREVTLEAAPAPESEPEQPPAEPPAEPAPAEPSTPEEAQPAAPEEASEEVEAAAPEDAAQE